MLRKLEFHHMPKYAKRLDMVEIEIGGPARLWLARRIPDLITLIHRSGRVDRRP